MPKFTALIIGIDGWEKYTLPLVESLQEHEPDCKIIVIDNGSEKSYPVKPYVYRTARTCYSKAINTAAKLASKSDWYIVLSNDVLCTGPFIHFFEDTFDIIAGPCLKTVHDLPYLEGWCVFAHSTVWDELGGWDENYKVSSWEDVDFTTSALLQGFDAAHVSHLPFVHLDQKQRFGLVPDYWQSEVDNVAYFAKKHAAGK